MDDFDRMVESQNGLCAICGSPPKEGKRLHVDHCHSENFVRGLLCANCNMGLGSFKDDPSRLTRAARYIKKSRTDRLPK